MNKLRLLTVIAVAVCILVVVVALMRCNATTSLHISHEGQVEITPTQIDSIRSIGQWEFLSIADEEIVDTVRHGFFGDDQPVTHLLRDAAPRPRPAHDAGRLDHDGP